LRWAQLGEVKKKAEELKINVADVPALTFVGDRPMG